MMNSADASSNENNGISLATMTAGIIAAVVFLLISSLLSNDTSWPMTSDRVWMTRTLTGDEIAQTKVGVTSGVQSEIASKSESQDEEGHFLDALYRTEFMRIFTEPT
ncbi:MAG: hypothetical protein ACAH08_07570 [Methylophilus sp.]|uniref:hypothetical protein n=1 Tax=Methylophilus sp. TaxID=29541 RepID=UPI002CDBE438|nr:hypothetical protein [Methylophilus sp.]HSH87194.1 hypothetical protein [Methylophilus sp.]